MLIPMQMWNAYIYQYLDGIIMEELQKTTKNYLQLYLRGAVGQFVVTFVILHR